MDYESTTGINLRELFYYWVWWMKGKPFKMAWIWVGELHTIWFQEDMRKQKQGQKIKEISFEAMLDRPLSGFNYWQDFPEYTLTLTHTIHGTIVYIPTWKPIKNQPFIVGKYTYLRLMNPMGFQMIFVWLIRGFPNTLLQEMEEQSDASVKAQDTGFPRGGGRQSPFKGGTLIADSAMWEPTCFNDVWIKGLYLSQSQFFQGFFWVGLGGRVWLNCRCWENIALNSGALFGLVIS